MSLKWFLNSSFAQVFGHTDNNINVTSSNRSEVIACPNDQGHGQECVFKSLKDTKEDINGRIGMRKENTDGFQMPLHYPRYTKADYQKMEEWKLNLLLNEYGFGFEGSLDEKRVFAMGAFLWPDQL